MFKKLASNLPFNPGLIQQIVFYSKRLHKEQSLRRASFVFMAAALAVNIFAVSFPAQNTYAGSDGNIMVGGGALTKEGLLQKFDQDPWVQAVYESFDIRRSDIEKMTLTTINTKAGWAQPLVTAGRRPNGSTGEYPRAIAGTNVYVHGIDSAFSADTIQAFVCEAASCGRYKAVAAGCGNPINSVSEAPTPKLKQPIGWVDGSSCVSVFGWAFNNEYARYVHIFVDKPIFSSAVLGTNFFEVAATQDTRPDIPLIYPDAPSAVGWSWDGGPLINDGKEHSLWIYVTDRSSNFALLSGGEAVKVNFNCPKPVVVNCPSGPLAGKPAKDNDIRNCPESPVATCVKLTILSGVIQKGTEGKFIVTATALNGAKINGYRLDFGDGDTKTVNTSDGSIEINHKYNDNGSYTVKATALTSEGDKTSPDCQGLLEVKPQPVPCPHDAALLFSDANCKPCPENPVIPASNTELCIAKKVLSKKVANITQGIENADNTTAKPGDILEYTLITQNTAKRLDVEHTTKESISDILDYATLTDTGQAQLNTANDLIWPKTTIVAGSQLKQVFRVKIKESIPSTAPSVANAGTYDLKLINVYGNTTTVDLPCPTSLCAKGTIEKLPNTGPGSSLILTFVTVCIIGFFYMRSRMLAREMDIIKFDYSRGV